MLLWDVEWGDQVEMFLQIQEHTGVTPQRLQERPQLIPEARTAYEVFDLLDAGRPMGFSGPLPIPLTDIAAFFDIVPEPSQDNRLRLTRLIRRIDRAYLKKTYEKTRP